jgi:D-serine deaminase-like pyridoxal phosphate-dependent protein
MNYFVNSSSGMALAALLLLSSPAMAESQKDQARRAIAEASGKIDASIKVGTGGGALGLQNQARTSLRSARLDLASGLKAQAIIDANHASMLADAAIAETQRSHAAAENAQRSNTEALASTAQRSPMLGRTQPNKRQRLQMLKPQMRVLIQCQS